MALRSVDLARRAARLDVPVEGLAAVSALRGHLDSLEARHVEAAVREGLSWSQIASLLGVSRQAAHKKYAARLRSESSGAASAGGSRSAATAQAVQAVRLARQEAGAMGHRSVGPEHLLLGLLRDDRGPAIEALEAVGVSFAATRREVRRLYGDPEDGNGQDSGQPATEAPISHRARGTLEQALAEAGRRSDPHLGVEHILAALLRDVPGGAVRALAALGVTALDVWQELARCTGWSGAREGTSARRPSTEEGERSVTDEERPEKLSEEELDAQIGAALPDREVMSILPLLDPTDGVAIPILHHPPDPQSDPPPDEPETTTPD